ncbi:MAG: zinc-dependent metalloprotease [Flavobacteriales bacterium]
MYKSARLPWLLFIAFVLLVAPEGMAQKGRKSKNKSSTEKPSGKSRSEELKKINELTKNCIEFNGLFTMYSDTINGESWMAIPDSMLNREFIYFSHVDDGVAESGYTRGSYRSSKIISFHKHFGRLEVHAENTNYFFDTESPLSRAASANINTPILASLKIEGEDSTKTVHLISGDALFKQEDFEMIKMPSRKPGESVLGKLSKEKTKIHRINNYPENTEIIVDYVYDNPAPKSGGAALEDPRVITVRYQHSLLAMPEDGFTPRPDDARIGYFTTQVEHMTSTSSTPWKDMIHRWRLEKKDPEAEVSEPVKPIVWWIENTTPYEFREYIRTGVEKWNLAFEPLGFSNAVQVKVQPDSAEWDAGDIRYNVLRWTSSPSPRYSGYGPSFVNPRTGEILGADIMLEWSGMTGRLWRSEVFQNAGYESDEAEEDESELSSRALYGEMLHRCDAGQIHAQQTLFGLAALRARSFDSDDQERFTRETLHRLVLHEVGHTLGLSHNMAGSTMQSPEDLKNAEVVNEQGMSNSVMDYPSINFARNSDEQTKFFDDAPGPYDHWAIEYGYSVSDDDPLEESQRLEEILRKSTHPDLMFGNDADDMRRPGGGMNPDVNIYDLSSDPVAYAAERCELVNDLLPGIIEEYGNDDQSSFLEVRRAYLTLTGEYITQLGVMTRQIGGIRYNRAHPSQQDNAPLQPVSAEDQKAAMDALATYAFAPDAFEAATSVYGYLQDQRRGFGFFASPEDPKIHARIISSQKNALNHLLHPRVLQRITDANMYGNAYTLDAFMSDLTTAIFKDDLKKGVNTVRQQLQIEYVKRLIDVLDPAKKYDTIAQSMALSSLRRIQREQKSGSNPDALTRAHREHLVFIIEKALNPG